jgi:hypothetical protein
VPAWPSARATITIASAQYADSKALPVMREIEGLVIEAIEATRGKFSQS